MLPHAYPFRFLDRSSAGGPVRVRVSGNAAASRNGELPWALGIEILAQAALVLLADGQRAGGGQAYLAGLDGVDLRRPLRPGDEAVAGARLVGRFGPLVKVHAWLEDEVGELLAGELLLALEREGGRRKDEG